MNDEWFKNAYNALCECFADEISMGKEMGYTIPQIADVLYRENKISRWEKNLLEKGETLWMKQD